MSSGFWDGNELFVDYLIRTLEERQVKAKIKEVKELSMDLLEIGMSQARTNVKSDKSIEELADSIAKIGLLEPIVVCPSDEEGRYEILTGQRRFLAHERLGRTSILCAILAERVDPDIAKAISLTENMMRQDLSHKEYIDACTALYRRYGTIKMVADELGLPVSKVSKYVKYDQLIPPLKKIVDTVGVNKLDTALRAQKAAMDETGQVDEEKAIALAETMMNLSGLQQKNIEKAAEENRGASVEEIIEAGRKQPKQRQIVVTIGESAFNALQKFTTDEGTSQDDAAASLLEFALTEQGYL